MLIRDARLADGRVRDVRVVDGRITRIGQNLQLPGTGTVVDADTRLLLPGMIDAHVHFRQPGHEHKETWTTGSRSAAAGGVTTVIDQPNTDPPTVTGAAVREKLEYAAASLVDYGVNGGVTPEWDPDSLFTAPICALGEVFLADSTGDMGITTDRFADAVLAATDHGVPVTVHAEDASLFDESARERTDADAWSAYRTAEAEIAAVEYAIDVANDVGATVHIAHTSTPEAADLASEAGMTCEVTPHHLFLSRADLGELGTLGRMNPPLRSAARRETLFERLRDGTVDLVATDHAPHTLGEKDRSIWEAPSGVPGVETALPLLLAAVERGALDHERVAEVTAAAPARLLGLSQKGHVAEGYDADLALFDTDRPREITGDALHSRCGWTPFEGLDGVFPEWTMVRGEFVYRREDDEPFGAPVGRNVVGD